MAYKTFSIMQKLILLLTPVLITIAGLAQKPGPASLGIIGDPKDIKTLTSGGTMLVGGGGVTDESFRWMISKSGGGDVVVITASGHNDYNKMIYDLGGVNSVETLNITSKEQANDPATEQAIRNAEMIFIGGGDQSNYMRNWRGTKTADAINWAVNIKKIPIGGTSAGCAILSGIYYSGENGSAVSDSSLANPFVSNINLYNNDLLHVPYLKNVITDQHYLKRKREGRHVAFLARAISDFKVLPFGIAPDEKTSVCIDQNGNAKVIGESKAYFIKTVSDKLPESLQPEKPLHWNHGQQALEVYEIQGTPAGAGSFSVKDFDTAKAKGGNWYWWYIDNGTLVKKEKNTPAGEKYVLVIHGGAGTILKSSMTAEKEKAYTAALRQALEAGYAKLKTGKSSLDAVQAAINILEDSPLFNAGKGAVFTNDGRNELDASIMDGKTLKAGAVAGVTIIKNPIDAARAVMEKSEHVMMVGKGAESFARQHNITITDPKYFYTKERWDGLQKAKQEEKIKLDHSSNNHHNFYDQKFGTVGAVALDNNGNLAAGTSTGGMTNKRFGRVGDSPIIGAGTYANNKTVAVSCTGWGEFYIRNVVAYDLSAMIEYKSFSVEEAGNAVIKKVGDSGGDGGLIAIDKNGNIAMPFNTPGMYRGAVTSEGKIVINIYR